MTDYPDWQNPAANALQIAAAGVPLLTKSVAVLSLAGQVIAAGAQYRSAPFPVSQVGYELQVNAQVGAAATVPFAKVQLNWMDSATGITVSTDTFYMPMSLVLPGFLVNGRGPSKADCVAAVITNLDPAQPATVTFTLLQNSRIYLVDQVEWNNDVARASAVPGYTLAGLPSNTEVLGYLNQVNVAATSTAAYLAGTGSGRRARLTVATGAASPANVKVNLYPYPPLAAPWTLPLVPQVPPAADYTAEFIAPRFPLLLQVQNLAATSITVSATIIQQS